MREEKSKIKISQSFPDEVANLFILLLCRHQRKNIKMCFFFIIFLV